MKLTFDNNTEREQYREALAALEHAQWAHWTQYQLLHRNGDNIRRWWQQINTPYDELTETEKDSDRAWADKVLRLLEGEG